MSQQLLVLELGSGLSESIARKFRGEGIYTEIVRTLPEAIPAEVRGLVITGGYDSAHSLTGALNLNLPVLALGDAAASLAIAAGGSVAGQRTINSSARINFGRSPLFDGMTDSDRYFDKLYSLLLPEGFSVIAFLDDGTEPAFADPARNIYALQFLPESNDPDGLAILRNFAIGICGITENWTVEEFVDRAIESVRETVGGRTALVTISGGVDSAVCAALMHRAIGDRLKCLFIDTGLMRQGEPDFVETAFRDELGIDVIRVDASDKFLDALEGLETNEEKRRTVERVMDEVYREEAAKLAPVDFLANGTIYSDILNYDTDQAAPEDHVLEPLRTLFKNEVRMAGDYLRMPPDLLYRPSFPGPGFAVRCIGEITRRKLRILRAADAIFREEMVAAGQDRRTGQFFTVLTDITTQAFRGESIQMEYALVLRAVSSGQSSTVNAARLPYDLLERVFRRINEEVPGVNRVLYDLSTTPPALIEWE